MVSALLFFGHRAETDPRITSPLPATLTGKRLPHLDAASNWPYDGIRYDDSEGGRAGRCEYSPGHSIRSAS